MIENKYDTERQEHLEQLWSMYKEKLEDGELRKIVNRNYVYSKIPDNKKNIILVVGINPSFRVNEKEMDYFSFKYEDVCDDQYYKRIKQIVPNNDFRIEYTDLFYYRVTKQEIENEFLNNEVGLKFMAEQLCITQKYIEAVQPKLIVVFNKGSWKYWGKEYNEIKDTNVWMGYNFEPNKNISCKNKKVNEEICFLIKNLKNSKQRVCNDLKETKLKGTPIYFSKYLGYLSKEEKSNITQDLKLLIESIKK